MFNKSRYKNEEYDFFLCSSLRSLEYRNRNSLIISLLESHNFSIYAPQIEMPVSLEVSDQEIFCKNFEAIQKSKHVLVVFEDAGEGVFLEVGIAFALKKIIIAFTHGENSGRMIKGLLDKINDKANSLIDLEKILNTLK